LGQYIQERKQKTRLPEQDSKDRTARTGQLGQDNGIRQHDMSVGKGHLGQNHSDRTAGTGQS
jgi:hypothetical protein